MSNHPNAAAIKTWIRQHGLTDTIKIVRALLIERPVTGTTPATERPRHDALTRFCLTRLNALRDEYTAITDGMSYAQVQAVVVAAYTAAANTTAARDKVVIDRADFMAIMLTLKSHLKGNPDETVALPGRPIFGDSVAEANGWSELLAPNDPARVIEEILSA